MNPIDKLKNIFEEGSKDCENDEVSNVVNLLDGEITQYNIRSREYRKVTLLLARLGYARKGYINLCYKVLSAVPSSEIFINNTVPLLEKYIPIVLGDINVIDVSRYEDTNLYDVMQLSWLRKGLHHNLDISKYDDPNFSHVQMRLLFKDLLEGLDVSQYAHPKFSTNEMRNIKAGLLKGCSIADYPNGEDWRLIISIRDTIREENIKKLREEFNNRKFK